MPEQDNEITASSFSAVHRTPVEIWMTIFSYLLEDDTVFRSNPFYPGCNPHTALREWNNYPRFRGNLRQHRSLRAVCRSWNDLAGSIPYPYYELSGMGRNYIGMGQPEIVAHIHRSTRLYFDSERPPCECICYCKCAKQDSRNGLSLKNPSIGQNIRDVLCHPDSKVTILSMSASAWDWAFDSDESSKHLKPLDLITALDLFQLASPSINIPAIFPNLTFLSIHVGSVSKYPYGIIVPIVFPLLSTLILSLTGEMNSFLNAFKMPRLQNLEVIEYGRYGAVFPILTAREWPYLVNLKVLSSREYIVISDRVWSSLPALQYLALSAMSPYTDVAPPVSPSNHPLHTLANLDMEGTSIKNSRRRFAQILQSWASINTAADSHSWSEFKQVDDISLEDVCHHAHDSTMNCQRCIQQLEAYCQLRGIRYEDRFGRSWEEYLALQEGMGT